MSRRIVTLRPGVELVQEDPWFPLGQDTLLLARFAAERARGRGLDLGLSLIHISEPTRP